MLKIKLESNNTCFSSKLRWLLTFIYLIVSVESEAFEMSQTFFFSIIVLIMFDFFFSNCMFQQAENFCNSVGVLQQFATSSQFTGFERPASKTAPPQPEPTEDYAALFSKLIARTAKDIDVLIDSLPSEESSLELQVTFIFLYYTYRWPRIKPT